MGHTNKPKRSQRGITLRISFQRLGPVRLVKALFALLSAGVMKILTARLRWRLLLAVAVLVLADVFGLINPYFKETSYALGKSAELLPTPNQTVAGRIKFDEVQQRYNIEAAATTTSADSPVYGESNLAGLTAHKDPSRGITVSDPSSKIDFTMTPQFDLLEGRQDQDRIVYPLKGNDGFAVYTMRSTGVKEDIVLTKSDDDTRSFSHTLKLGDGLKAKVEVDGSIGVYGNNLLSGEVTTGSDKDAKLLEKARQNAPKNTLVFNIPAPVVTDTQGVSAEVTAKYSLQGNTLTVTASGLKKANYPLSIDPTIYVTSAQQLMAGNGESNLQFDVANKQVRQAPLTGGSTQPWTTDNEATLPTAMWGAGAVATAGNVYTAGGTDGTSAREEVQWAKINGDTDTITSANPGDGACDGWCTDLSYNLPDARTDFTLTAYNGYLYALGGRSTNCTTGNNTGNGGYCDTIYIAKLGANGEPRLWHPTDENSDNWTYWYRNSIDLPTERVLTKAVMYNNHVLLLGGISSSGVLNTAGTATINPDGTIGTWDLANYLPSARYQHDALVYNDKVYLVGGASSIGGAPTNTVHYATIRDDGYLSDWSQTSSFSGGIMASGANFSTFFAGHLYVTGGCSAVNGSGYCTTVNNTTQYASVRADGSLGAWKTAASGANARIGQNIFSWDDTIYSLGGCTAQNTTTGACTNLSDEIRYAKTTPAGDISPVRASVASGGGTCTGGSPANCNLPDTSHIGNFMNTSIATNGHLYIFGGCTSNDCSSISNDVIYAAISSDGTLQKPSVCEGNVEGGMWCAFPNVLPDGAARSATVFNDRIYLTGGMTNATTLANTVVSVTIGSDGTLDGLVSQQLSGTGDGLNITSSGLAHTATFTRANPSEAGSYPGNLYIIGGCTGVNVGECTSYTDTVYKCWIKADGRISDYNDDSGHRCTTTSQLQLGTVSGGSSAGLAMAGIGLHGDYIYLLGGSAPGIIGLSTTRYAKINSSNNIVSAASGWVQSGVTTSNGRYLAGGFVSNGVAYTTGGYNYSPDNTAIQAVNYSPLNSDTGDLISSGGTASGTMRQSPHTITGRWGMSLVTYGSHAYVIGGCTAGSPITSWSNACSTRTASIQTFDIENNDSGSPTSYTTSANTYSSVSNRFGAGVTIYDGRIYVAGGCSGTASCTSTTASVTYAPLSDTGAIGGWSDASANLPAARGFGKLIVGGSSLYFVGGQTNAGTAQSTIYYATPASNGNISAWGTASSGLPNARSDFGATSWNDRIYVVGGKGTSGDCTSGRCDTVYVSPDLSLGGNITASWSTASDDFSIPRSGATLIANSNTLYLLGGYDGTNYLSDVQFASIDDATGEAGSWSRSSNLPRPIAQGDGFSANGYLYISGGRSSATSCSPTTLIAPIGGISSEAAPVGVGTWYEASAKYTGDRFGNATVYHDGKSYVVGGADCRSTSTEYTSATSNATFTVPSGVTDITVKAWGGGAGGGGGGSFNGYGGYGGSGGYATSILNVTPSESLTVRVGGGGVGGNSAGTGGGGGGGGYSGVFRSTTPLLIAGGGGGGGGSRASTTHGGNGGVGGCTSSGASCTGSTSVTNGGGGGGSTSGGTAGVGNCNGAAGSSLTGGNGANKSFFTCGTTSNSAGGTNGGGGGGIGRNGVQGDNSGGGGGGGGYYGGGGGSGGGNESTGAGGGGGGGSSYVTGASTFTAIGNGQTPGNASDSDRGTAGQGGSGGSNSVGTNGNVGKVIVYDGILTYPSPAITQTTLEAQPQIAKYSILFDMEADVFPNHWIINGDDQVDSTRWQITYRSMTNPEAAVQCGSGAMSTWGQPTVFAAANLGIPSLLSAKNEAGTATNCTRFFTFDITMDSSRSASFPYNPSHSPAVDEVVLSMVTNPAKRLRHGRSFIGGLQSPIDTPYYGY